MLVGIDGFSPRKWTKNNLKKQNPEHNPTLCMAIRPRNPGYFWSFTNNLIKIYATTDQSTNSNMSKYGVNGIFTSFSFVRFPSDDRALESGIMEFELLFLPTPSWG